MALIDLQFTTLRQRVPQFIFDDIQEFVGSSNSYHHQPTALTDAISLRHKLATENVLLTAGADQAIQMILGTHGGDVHVFTPTYIGYSDAERLGCKLIEHPSLNSDQYEIGDQSFDDGSIVIIANPNNPVGITFKDDILKLVKKHPGVTFVIDEVYGEFADESVIDEVNDHPNLVVLRSFSKSYGLAGFRIGFVVASKEFLEKLNLETSWFNVSYPAVGAALSALNHESDFEAVRREIIETRDEFAGALDNLGYVLVPSFINSVLIRFEDEAGAKDFQSYLDENNVRVSLGNGASNIGLSDEYVRIAIGTKQDMETVSSLLKDRGT